MNSQGENERMSGTKEVELRPVALVCLERWFKGTPYLNPVPFLVWMSRTE